MSPIDAVKMLLKYDPFRCSCHPHTTPPASSSKHTGSRKGRIRNSLPHLLLLLAVGLAAGLHATCGANLAFAQQATDQETPPTDAESTQADPEQPVQNQPVQKQPTAEPPTGVYAGPVVAQNQMNLILKGEVLDTIEIGDLLTVLAERDESLVIQTYSGHKGAVAKGSVVALSESASVYDKLIARAPNEGRLYTLRAGAHYAKGAHERALADYDKAIELGYEQSHAYTSRGLFHASMGHHDAALKDFTRAIELDGEDSVSLMNRASVYLTVGSTEKAVADYTAALKLKPGSAVLFTQRAVAHKIAGNLPAAIADYNQSIEIQPDDVTALMGRGFVAFQAGDHEAAVTDFSSVIKLSPQSAVAYNNRGFNYQQLGKEKLAMQDFVKATELAPKYLLALRNRAWLATLSTNPSVANPATAIDVATAVCEITEYNDFSDLLLLAAAYASATEFETAIGWQEKAAKIADKPQSELSEKILQLYHDNKPIDPSLLEDSK